MKNLRWTFFCIPYLLFSLICLHNVYAKVGINSVKLSEDNWSDMLTDEWMVEFYAPWCPACKSLESEWESFATWSDDLNLRVGSVDVTTNPGLSGRFMVTALPTIYHVKDGVFRQYHGARNSNAFVAFVEEKQYEKIQPISNWKAPDSYQMSVVSYFFKISMTLRSVHNRLVEEYGVPYWGSYVLFAFATILLGALLGLLIVCIIDLVFPAKTGFATPRPPLQSVPASSEKDDGDLIEEDDASDGTDVRHRKTATLSQENTPTDSKED